MPEYRHRGVFEALLGQAAEAAEKPLRMTLASDHPCRNWVRSAAEKLDFVPGEQVTVFSCRREDEAVWRRFMETRGRRMCTALERQGYRAVPFTALDGSLTEQLRASDRSEYGNTFYPGLYLDEPARRLRPDLSAAAVRDGKLKAYCLVTEGDENTAMFDQISVAADVMGRGVILLPYVTAMELFLNRGLSGPTMPCTAATCTRAPSGTGF